METRHAFGWEYPDPTGMTRKIRTNTLRQRLPVGMFLEIVTSTEIIRGIGFLLMTKT